MGNDPDPLHFLIPGGGGVNQAPTRTLDGSLSGQPLGDQQYCRPESWAGSLESCMGEARQKQKFFVSILTKGYGY